MCDLVLLLFRLLLLTLQAYERGQYDDSVTLLEKAVEQAGKGSMLGGEAMMWLALGYQVNRVLLTLSWQRSPCLALPCTAFTL